MRRMIVAATLIAAALALGACNRQSEARGAGEHPVAQWLDDNEDCTRASAKAIIESGLPYPNRKFEAYVDTQGRQKQRVISRDMWLGPDRFVIPGAVLGSNSMWPEYHPRHYHRLAGTLPHFYPPGPSNGVIDGMASMVDVHFTCSMEPAYVATWGKGYRSNEEGIEKVRAMYQKRALNVPTHPGEVTLNRREDIGMFEVLFDRKSEANGERTWEATYWPLNRELKGPDGSVSPIRCAIRHDPEKKRYGGIGWRCSTGLRLTQYASVRIDIYVTHLTQMPAVFDQVQRLLVNAKQQTTRE